MLSTSFELPSSAEEFRRRRSDRTAKCLNGTLPPQIHVCVRVDSAVSLGPVALQALETLCNLLGRFCPQVSIQARDASSAPWATSLIAILRATDPYGDYAVVAAGVEADLHIHTGPGRGPPGRTLYMDFGSWSGVVSATPFPSSPHSNSFSDAIGGEIAACITGAAAFRFWVSRTLPRVPFGLDLYDLIEVDCIASGTKDRNREPKELRVLMVGAGSVGSAAAYFLPRIRFRGSVDPVDGDIVKIENLDRSPAFIPRLVGMNKAEVVASYLRAHSISSLAFPVMWNEFVAGSKPFPRSHDLWLPLANEQGVRLAMQNNCPPVSIQSSTGKNWNVQYGRHIPFVDDCQMDRFPSQDTAPTVCATGQVATSKGREDAALPFCSFIAGLLVAAGIIRHSLGGPFTADNAAFFSADPDMSLWTRQREPSPRCVCQGASKAIWESTWAIEESMQAAST